MLRPSIYWMLNLWCSKLQIWIWHLMSLSCSLFWKWRWSWMPSLPLFMVQIKKIYFILHLVWLAMEYLIALLVTMERDANYQEVNVFANLLWSMMEQMNNAFRLWVAIIAGISLLCWFSKVKLALTALQLLVLNAIP